MYIFYDIYVLFPFIYIYSSITRIHPLLSEIKNLIRYSQEYIKDGVAPLKMQLIDEGAWIS